jgi:hypothetical protein
VVTDVVSVTIRTCFGAAGMERDKDKGVSVTRTELLEQQQDTMWPCSEGCIE